MNLIKTLLITLFLNSLIGCAPVYYESNFKGIVIDEETNEPIENAVILALWDTTFCLPTPAGEVCEGEYVDSYSTLTDKKGAFVVPGKFMRFFTTLDKMYLIAFKTGYMKIGIDTEGDVRMSSLKKDSSGHYILRTRKLTLEQMKNYHRHWPHSPPNEVPFEVAEPYLIESNKHYMLIGYKPTRTWKGKPIKVPEPQKQIVEIKAPQQFTGPCKLEYKVYKENGEWKVGFYQGVSPSALKDNRPECIKEREEMEKLYYQHIRNKE